ncbi:hypothetical protein [Brevundimonas sp.]|uniref:hypothetical protein n=1 Tax=Brevundimonas sp. TaxID=1871086 RepID=UPI003F73114B
MVRCLPTLILAVATLSAGTANACPAPRQPPVEEARGADAVFVGYVTAFEPGARIDVKVDHVISDEAPERVTVLWRRAINYGPPQEMEGDYLFAVDRLEGTASIYVVNQRSCVPGLVFERGSFHANAIREMFGLWPEPEAPKKSEPAAAPVPVGPVAGLLLLPPVLAAGAILLRGKRCKRADRIGL